jgi:glycerophosphoryl diester phosphodiesterase
MTNSSIFAHRGASAKAPENTLTAIKLAWQQLADGVEIDVHLSRDNQIVVIHDDNTARTTGKNRKVTNQTLHELQTFDAGSWKNRRWKNERIPSLKEVLEIVPADKQIMIEIKTGPEIVTVLKRTLKRCKLDTRQIILASFSLASAGATKKCFPDYKTVLISELNRTADKTGFMKTTETLFRKAAQAKLDGLSLQTNRFIDQTFIEKIQERELKLYVWTLNSAVEAMRFSRLGVDGIITDCPKRIRSSMLHSTAQISPLR